MAQSQLVTHVRQINPGVSVIDIQGNLSSTAEQILMDAYAEASGPSTRAIVLNFCDLTYMNSSGIGLLVTLLIRINRQKQQLVCYGLSEHYLHIFHITRLSDAIKIFDDELAALAALGS